MVWGAGDAHPCLSTLGLGKPSLLGSECLTSADGAFLFLSSAMAFTGLKLPQRMLPVALHQLHQQHDLSLVLLRAGGCGTC